MSKISKETVESWKAQFLERFSEEHRLSVTSGWEAWNVFHHFKWSEIYQQDRNVLDAHIQTALEKVFPNCVFLSKKVY